MSVQMCEGVWRTRCGQRLYITEREPVHGQRWTDGLRIYSDDGSWALDGHETIEDLVEYIGPLPQQDQTAEIERLKAELEQSQGVRKSLSAKIERLQTELRGYAADSHRQLRNLQESHNKVTANLQAEQRGEREGFRIAISMILEKLK